MPSMYVSVLKEPEVEAVAILAHADPMALHQANQFRAEELVDELSIEADEADVYVIEQNHENLTTTISLLHNGQHVDTAATITVQSVAMLEGL